MKKILLALFLFSATAQAQTTYPSGVTGCIARYDFNGPVTSLPDVSGNNHPATDIINLSSASGFRNRVGNAMHFNGVSSVARANPSTQFNLSQVSIVAMVKFTGFYQGDCQGNAIINRSNNYYTTGTWGMDISDQAYDHSCSVYSPGNMQMSFVGSAATGSAAAGNYLTQNDWYLMVASYDGNTATLYQTMMDPINKASSIAPVNTVTLGNILGSNYDSLYIGRLSHPQFPYWLNADVDEIAVFNKPLTATEVTSIYNYLWQAGVGVADNNMLDNASVAMANNVLQIKNPRSGKLINATVYDMTGRTLARRMIREDLASIDLSSYAAGMLMVRLESDGMVVTKKINKL